MPLLEHETKNAFGAVSVYACSIFEHITQQLLDGCIANCPVKEQLLYLTWIQEAERW